MYLGFFEREYLRPYKSSPRKKGNSNTLADEFIRGAQEAGHEVQEFDCARNKVAPCLSCGGCIRTGKCVQKDGFEEFAPMFVEADVLVYWSPEPSSEPNTCRKPTNWARVSEPKLSDSRFTYPHAPLGRPRWRGPKGAACSSAAVGCRRRSSSPGRARRRGPRGDGTGIRLRQPHSPTTARARR